MRLASPAFDHGTELPRKYTADGDNVSPPLRWWDVPPGTGALALILDDVKTTGERRFTHWLIYNIPPSLTELPEGLRHHRHPELPGEVTHGSNSLQNVGYDGPAPAVGATHHYEFRLFALDAPLRLAPGADRESLERALEGHVLDETVLEAVYSRQPA